MSDLATMWSSLQMQLDAHRPDAGGADGSDPFASAADTTPAVSTPVCLLTGFLGAGKSTLLAALLTDPPAGMVVRALVNDAGSLPFDPTLISVSDDVSVELNNGCGCCTATADLAAGLDQLAARPGADLIVLEASGMADPLAVAQVVTANRAVLLDRIVTVVAATGFDPLMGNPMYGPMVRRQLEASHCVVVTHADRLGADELAATVDHVVAAAPGRVVTTSSPMSLARDVLTPGSVRGARPLPDSASVDHPLQSVTLSPRDSVRLHNLRALLLAARPSIVRVKGRIVVDEEPHLVQMTTSSLTITPTADGPRGITVFASDMEVVRPIATALGSPI